MSHRFAIEIDWERLDRGHPEERVTYGAIGLRVDEVWLTEAHDTFVRRVRQKVHLSGYLLAEWFAWNWWRLRWEPKRQSLDWKLAHRLTTIGGGYIWPNIACNSDGERVLLRAIPSPTREAEPLRYVADVCEALPATEFQAALEQFIELVLEQLRTERIRDSNLERTWGHVVEERRDPDAEWSRRLEAAMGYDPDEASEQVVAALIAESGELGKNSVAELAAGASRIEPTPTSKELKALARSSAHEARFADIPRLPAEMVESSTGDKPAWVAGEDAARALRNQERLGDGALSDEKLAELAGTDATVLSGEAVKAPFSFALNGDGGTAKVVLVSSFAAGRRFALARLIGDRLLEQQEEPLIPVMRSFSYRQKRQRAFAAELLCPFEQASQLLDLEFSEESQERMAAEYRVSPMLVRTQLVNKGLLERQALENF